MALEEEESGAKTSHTLPPDSPLASQLPTSPPISHPQNSTIAGTVMEREFGGNRSTHTIDRRPRPHSTHFANTNVILPTSQPIPSAASASSFPVIIDNSMQCPLPINCHTFHYLFFTCHSHPGSPKRSPIE